MAKRTRAKSGGWRRGEFVAGIVLGLVLALWVYPMITQWLSEPSSGSPPENPSSGPTFDFYDIFEQGEEVVEENLASASEATPEPADAPAADPPADTAPETVAAAPTEPTTAPPPDSEPGPPTPSRVEAPGMYVLQLGTFTRQAGAESLKARLALVGMTARIQPVIIDRQTHYRVRIGPIDDLEQLNASRAQLRQHRFDFYLLKLVQ